jgi:hypothetical protein
MVRLTFGGLTMKNSFKKAEAELRSESGECKINVDGYQIEVITDEDPESPRTAWDNLGTMWCFHRDYLLGDKDKAKPNIHHLDEPLDSYIKRECDPAIVLPLFLYDHSGISMSTSSFSCPWDSGMVGVIFISKADVRKEFGVKRITKQLLDRVTQILISEVKTYDQYLTNSVYGCVITDPDGEEESCWGYYGYSHDKSGLADFAISTLESMHEARRSDRLDQLKVWIRNRVPLYVRQSLLAELA